jgi:hypothetical protein
MKSSTSVYLPLKVFGASFVPLIGMSATDLSYCGWWVIIGVSSSLDRSVSVESRNDRLDAVRGESEMS